MTEEHRGRNWRSKYLTKDEFFKFVHNDFYHLKLYAKASFWISLTVLAVIIAKFIMD